MNATLPLGVAVVTLSLIHLPVRATEPDIDYDRHARAVEHSARDELAPSPSRDEQIRHELIHKAFQATAGPGAWSAIKDKTLTNLHVRQAAMAALMRNLTVESSRNDRARAAEAIEEAKAVFNPVFSLSIDYNETQTFRRATMGKINKKAFNPVDIAGIPVTQSPGVTGINYRSQAEAFGIDQEIEASEDSAEGPSRVFTYTVALDQQLPWGPKISLSNVTKEQKVFYRTGFYWEDGKYSSTLTLNLNSGVPLGRGFGPYAPSDAALLLREQAEKSSDWTLRETINDVLLSTDVAYWTLVRRLEELHVNEQNLDQVRHQMERVQRLFSMRRATNYEKAEIEAKFARATVQVETARNNYVGASNDLAVLIENEVKDVQSRIYMPFAYTGSLESRLTTNLDAAMKAARENRPDIFINRIGTKSADISLKASETAALPGITADATLKHEQNGSLFGYRDAWSSISHLNRPDFITQTYSLSYGRPWGNVAAEAGVDRSRLSVMDQDVVSRQTDQSVTREINDNLSSMGSARARHKRARAETARLEKSLEGMRRRRDIGADITLNEIILTTRSLLAARLGGVSALIDNKIAESRLLAAQGTLGMEYGARTVTNGMDKRRLDGLAAKGLLSFFRPRFTAELPAPAVMAPKSTSRIVL